jgi:hypothetical protein
MKQGQEGKEGKEGGPTVCAGALYSSMSKSQTSTNPPKRAQKRLDIVQHTILRTCNPAQQRQ